MEDALNATTVRGAGARTRGRASASGGGWARGRRGERARPAPDQGSADLDAALAELGLSQKASWYTSAALYGGGGVLVTIVDALQPALFPPGLLYLAMVAMSMGAICLFAARRHERWRRVGPWATHARLVTGLAIWVAGTIILGDRAVVFTLIPLFTILTPCYLCPLSYALFYAFGATAVVVLMVLTGGEPDRTAHALISGTVFVGIAASLSITRRRTRALAQRNRQLAFTDPLTGIANMRALRERIGSDRASGERTSAPFALFVMDLDNFKEVNDHFDHSFGDRVLCAVAAALEGTLEPGDLAIRRGGDEFAVFVPDPGDRDLDALAAHLQEAIVQARLLTCPGVTPSGGVAWVRTRPGEELASTIERADDALHRVKAAARARRMAGEDAPAATPAPRDRDAPCAGAQLPPGQAESASAARARAWRVPARWLVRTVSGADPDWGFTALALLPAAAGVALVSLTGMAAPLSAATGGAVAAGVAALALIALVAGRGRVRRSWLHLVWAALFGLLVVAIAEAGRAGTVLLDLLPGFAVFAVLVFRGRAALLEIVSALVAYGAFANAGGYPYAVTRTVATAAVVAIMAGVVARLRVVTVRFARRNRELSEVDSLTGLANLRALRDRVVDAVECAHSKGSRPLVLAIDLDHFKQVNDNHSHSVGDRVLVAVARAVSQCVRVDELVARRGGDEFAVVLEDARTADVDAIRGRIAAAIENARTRVCPDVPHTASIACVPWVPGEAPARWLERADVALHEAKLDAHACARGPLAAPAHTPIAAAG
jgi:diguanylate cyclase (GGDEF)-like protein